MADILGNIEDPVVPLNEIYADIQLLSLVGKTVRRHVLGSWMEKKYQLGSVCLFIEHKDCFLSVHADDTKHARKEEESGSGKDG